MANHLTNDDGQEVIAFGAPASVERVKVERPRLIRELNSLYMQAFDSPGRGVDEAIEKIRQAGVTSPLETRSLLQASDYSHEPAGSVTSLVASSAMRIVKKDGKHFLIGRAADVGRLLTKKAKKDVPLDLGWTLSKRADDASELRGERYACTQCRYEGGELSFKGGRCPECDSNKLATA